MYAALSAKYPADRMGQTHFWEDLNYSSYSYERFHDEIANAPNQEVQGAADPRALVSGHRAPDVTSSRRCPNFGYYLPRYRALNESHCTTIVDFENGDIQEDGLVLANFINNVLERHGARDGGVGGGHA